MSRRSEDIRILEPSDTPEMIETCLSCAKAECTNCMKYGPKDCARGRRATNKIPVRKLIDLYNAGSTVPVMSVRLGIDGSTLRGRLASLGLPCKRGVERPVLTEEYLRSFPTKIINNLNWEGTKWQR